MVGGSIFNSLVQSYRAVIASIKAVYSGQALTAFLLSTVVPLVGVWGLAALGVAAQAEGVLLQKSCAAVAVSAGGGGGAEPVKYVWGEMDGRIHAIFRVGHLTYAIPAENFRESNGILTSSGGTTLGAGAIPAEAIPAEAIPAEAIPSNAIPSNAIPSNLIPSWSLAQAMPQVAAGGFLRLNDGSTLRHTWMMRDGEIRMAFVLNGYPYEMTRNQIIGALQKGAIPSNAIPAEAIPSNAIPAEAIPSNTLPSNLVVSAVTRATLEANYRGAIPAEGIPSNSVDRETWNSFRTGVQAIPAESIPSNGIPSNAIPAEAIPSNAIPAEAIPSNFVNAIPSNALVKMLPMGVRSGAIPAESWAGAAELGVETSAIPAEQHPWAEIVAAAALPSSALPSSALPSSALPSSALPSSGSARLSLKAQIVAPDDGIIVMRRDGQAPTMFEALMAQYDDGIRAGAASTAQDSVAECSRLILEDTSYVRTFKPDAPSRDGYICLANQVTVPGVGCVDYITASVTSPDADGDGYTVEQGDCADRNPDIHPGAEELDDSWDNDCDGRFNEGFECPSGYVIRQGSAVCEDSPPSRDEVICLNDQVLGLDGTCVDDSGGGFLFDIGGSEVIVADPPPPDDTGGTEYGDTGGGGGGDTTTGTTGGGGSGSRETIQVSFSYYNSEAPREIIETPSGSECPGAKWTQIDMWVTITRDGQIIPAGASDLSSATISWSGGGFSGSKNMSWDDTDVWTATVGNWGLDSVSADATLTVTVRATTSGGASDSGSGTLTLLDCDTSGVEYGGSG
jgi:hypothetical protein